MATSVNNPTNASSRPNQPLPFIRSASGKATVESQKQKDAFNNGKDYQDEGAPLLTSESVDGKPVRYPPFAAIVSSLVKPPTTEEMEALSHPDEKSQTQVKYLKEAVVMDVDAKLIISTEAQMKNGVFREAHYPTLIDYVRSPHFRRLREARIISERLAGLASKTKLREAGKETVAGIRLNPRLVNLYKTVDRGINRKLRESGFDKELKRLREESGLKRLKEDAFTQDVPNISGVGQLGPNWDGGQSFGLAGRELDFTPIMAGPFNKQLYWFDYLDMHSKAFEAWCLTGDTEIALLDGRNISILQLQRELKSEKFIWGYKYDQNLQKIQPVKMTHVYEMGEKDCVCVLLDNGRSFIASTDHPMLMRDGTYKESGKLQPDDSMMPLHRVYRTRKAMQTPEVRKNFEKGIKYRNHKVLAVYPVGKKKVYHIETTEQHYGNQNFALSVGVFSHNTHNPIAKRIVKVITQFVLGKGVKLTVMRAVPKEQENANNAPTSQNIAQMAQRIASGQGIQQPDDWKVRAQTVLDRHWAKNKLHLRGKKILRELVIFGEQFIRYFDAPWGLKMRQIDPSVVWEVVTDVDDCENEFYLHCQYPTRYQWYVDLPVPTIKFIIRQVPSALYYHMKINDTAGEVRGRSELFAILGWLKRLKEYASDRVVRNKMANLFVLDVAVEGDAAAVQQVQQQFATPPTPGSFFIHNKAAELNGIAAEVGASETQGDWEMLLTIIAMGAGISQEYLGMGQGAGGKAQALVGTEPDIKTFEDYQEMMEDFFLEDARRVYERAKQRGEIPKDLTVTVEATFPALAEENRSEKLKDYAFGESMSWWSHRRTASAAAKEMQMTSYDYDQEQQQIAEEDVTKEFLINTAYQQVTKGVDSAQAGAAGGGKSSGGTSSGSSGKGASGMGMGKALPTSSSSSPKAGESKGNKKTNSVVKIVKHALEESEGVEDTAPGTSTATNVSSFATTHNASVGADGKRDPWANQDPRDMASNIKREAANLRYTRHAIGRRQDRIQTPDKIRDQKSLDRGDLVTTARRAAKRGNLNREGGPGSGRHKEAVHDLLKKHPDDGEHDGLRISDIARKLGISKEDANHAIGELQDEDRVRPVRSGMFRQQNRQARVGNRYFALGESARPGADGHYRFPREREGGPGSGPHPESEQARVLLHKHLTGEFPGQKFSTIQALLKNGYLEHDGKNLRVSAKGKAWADENHMKVPSNLKREAFEPFKQQDGAKLQRPKTNNFPTEKNATGQHRNNPRGFGASKKERV